MKIWAIADLHLGFSTGKWMDIFGDHWQDHHVKVEAAWRERVSGDDLVLLPGDFSWAMKLSEVRQDFDWLAALPGKKVLIKGNHDYWWSGSHAKVQSALPADVWAIKKRAVVVDGVPIFGVRGADFCIRENQTPEDVEKRLVRERRELLASLDHLHTLYQGDRSPIAMFHYPPYPMHARQSAFTRILEDAGCRLCIFGHLHSSPEWERVFQGEERGIDYRLVSCDALGFEPVLLETL